MSPRLALLLVLLAPSAALAAIHKCTGKDGKPFYSDLDCPQGSETITVQDRKAGAPGSNVGSVPLPPPLPGHRVPTSLQDALHPPRPNECSRTWEATHGPITAQSEGAYFDYEFFSPDCNAEKP